jgi:nucleotide-binding universal stress UspA family protein
MFSSVLCPVDFSERAEQALRYGIALAGHARGRLTALYVAHPLLVEAAATGADVSVVTQDIDRELQALVAKVTTDARAWAPQAATHVSTGDPGASIVEYATDHAISMIVMGTHGLTGYRKMILGSVTERVLRSSTVPVFVVPQMEHDQISYSHGGPVFAMEKVLAPCDFSERSRADALIARDVAKTFNVPLMLLHVLEKVSAPSRWRQSLDEQGQVQSARAREQLDALATSLSAGSPVQTLVTFGSPAEEIAAVAAEHNVGLVVMGLTGEGERFGGRPGTTAYRVLSTAAAPILALR